MRRNMREIDAGLPQMLRRDTVVTIASDSVRHYLSIWLEDSTKVRKLMVTDSSERTGVTAQTSWWFEGGEVNVVQTITDMFAFDADRIILWADESLEPRTDITPKASMAKESAMMDEVRRWLDVFGVKLP